MLDWLTRHVEALVAAPAVALLLLLWKPARAAVERVLGMRRFVHDTETQYQTSLERSLKAKDEAYEKLRCDCDELKRDLADKVREADIRDDINKQDRETIRRLRARLDEHKVDYSDIDGLSFEGRLNAQVRDPLRGR